MARISPSTPAWACRILKREFPRFCPEVAWRRRKSPYSSGHAGRSRIVITEGTDPVGAKLTLLHEIAHAKGVGRNHDVAFYEEAWRLYRRYRMPILACLRQEMDYHPRHCREAYWRTAPKGARLTSEAVRLLVHGRR